LLLTIELILLTHIAKTAACLLLHAQLLLTRLLLLGF